MKTIALSLICLLACIPVIAQTKGEPKTPEQLRQSIDAVEGVDLAIIVSDEKGNPIEKPHPLFEGWKVAQIAYLYVKDGVVTDNAISVWIDPGGHAFWQSRPPSILDPVVERALPMGTEDEIISAIEQSQDIKALKYEISFDAKGADVAVAIDVSGKVVTKNFRAYKVDDEYVIKPYDIAESKELSAR